MPLDNIEFSRAAWKRLQTSYTVTQRPISLFIGPSADSAAASKTLRRLLQSYLIRAEIHIVENMDSAIRIVKNRAETYLADQQFLDIQHQQQSQQASQQIIDSTKEVAVFLGCGADRDLSKELDWSALTEIHVIDNCRPINLNLLRQSVASCQFLEAISEGSYNIPPKPERCIFLWEQASAEQEADEFFWRSEIAASRSNIGSRFRQGGRRRGRLEKRHPISSNSNNNNGDKAVKKNNKNGKPSDNNNTSASTNQNVSQDGEVTSSTKDDTTNNNGNTNKKSSKKNTSSSEKKTKNKKKKKDTDDLFAFLEESEDEDEDEDNNDDDADSIGSAMSSEESVATDDDDDVDEDFIQDDDESLGSRGSDDDEDDEGKLLGADDKKKQKNKNSKQKKSSGGKDATATLGGEDVEDQEIDDNESWLADSSEDEDDDDSGEEEDDDDGGDNKENGATNSQSQRSNNADTAENDGDWSSVFTGGDRTTNTNRSSSKNKKRRNRSGNDNDDDEDDDEEYYDDDDSSDEDEDDQFSDDDNDQENEDDDEDDLNRMDPVVAGQWRNEGVISAQRERAYYSRYWASRSLAVILHELSVRLEQADSEFVWHAAIGLADLHSRGLISSSSYEVEVRRLENAVSQFKNAIKRTPNGLALLPDNINQPQNYGNGTNNYNNINTNSAGGVMNAAPSSMGASGKLTRVRPLRHIKLFMLRHGSLWNALWYDRHVSAALGFHHISSGTARLEGLLAKIGMPRYEAELSWSSIASEKREAVLRLLYTELYQAGVADFDSGLYLPTLAKQVGYDSPVSAFDACHVFYGCIGAQPHHHHNIQKNTNNNNNNQMMMMNDNNNNNGNHAMNLLVEEYKKWQEDDYRRRFEAGIAVLGETPEAPLFQHAINSTFELQGAAADATASILSGAGGGAAATLASTQYVRYVTIPLDHRIASVDHFAVPARLRTLAMFLSAFTHNYRKNLKPRDPRAAALSLRPLVIGVADAETSQLTNGNIVLGTVALVVAPALTQSTTTCANASILPSKVLNHYRSVQASLHMNSKFCGVHRDISLGTVVGAEAIVEAGETLHLESQGKDDQSLFFA